MNYPNGVTQSAISNLVSIDFQSNEETCVSCKRCMVEQAGIWHYEETGRRIPGGPKDAPKGYLACSQKCLSQHVYDLASPDSKQVLRDMAKAAYTWFVGTEGCGLIWRLKHSDIASLVGAMTVTAVDTEISDMLKELAGDDFLNGDSDGPRWFMEAVGMGVQA